MKKIFKVGTSILLVFALATSLRAQIGSVDLTLPSTPIGDSVTVTPVGGGAEPTNAGPYTYDLSSPGNLTVANDLGLAYSGNTNMATSVQKAGFCIALTTDIYENVQYSDFQLEPAATSLTLTPTQLNNVIQLMNSYAAAAPPGVSLMSPSYNTSISDALSIAIWEVLDGKGIDGTATGYQVNYNGDMPTVPESLNDITVSWGSSSTADPHSTSYAVYLANQWLGALTNTTASLPSGDSLFALDGSLANAPGYPTPAQNQSIVLCLTASVTGSSSSTPEPKDAKSLAGLGLLGLAAGLVVAFRRRGGIALPRKG